MVRRPPVGRDKRALLSVIMRREQFEGARPADAKRLLAAVKAAIDKGALRAIRSSP